MIEEIGVALAACRSERDSWHAHQLAESTLTPLELAALLQSAERLPPWTQAWLARLASFGEFAGAEPQRFSRQPLADHIDIYRDPSAGPEQKQLIVAFCGAADRLMLPIPCILQYLPSDRCDVAVLRDPARQHYRSGVPGYADSFSDLVRRISRDLGLARYARAVCFGTSMGGLAALRCGILLGADRAIAAGGRFVWHPLRLLENPKRMMSAFDLLCDCNAATTVPLVCCYSSGNQTDVKNAAHLSRILPVQHIAVEAEDHNFIFELWKRGELRDFYDRLFGLPQAGEP